MTDYLKYLISKLEFLFVGSFLIVFGITTFGWMLGWFKSDSTEFAGSWASPGILSMPATIALFCIVIGCVMLVSIIFKIKSGSQQ